METIVKDPYLSDLKLWAKNWDEVRTATGTDRGNRSKEEKKGTGRRLSVYETGFMLDMRSFLKGDEGMLNQVALHVKDNPDAVASINYMANTNGFTLMDMVSYDHKHNEDNGEENHDGTDYNQSWNCGAEGPVRKKKIIGLRKRQLKNALTMLFLSQGTPLLMAGDEFGRTQKGNNNAYCQDNEISWLNWNLLDSHKGLYEFTKNLIAFRKKHSLFHRSTEPTLMDHKSVGLPDVSFHGEKAWCPDFERYSRQLGVFYSASYGENADGSEEPYFYTAYNMHWEPHAFALPNLPSGYIWHQVLDTAEDSMNGFCRQVRKDIWMTRKRLLSLQDPSRYLQDLNARKRKKHKAKVRKRTGKKECNMLSEAMERFIKEHEKEAYDLLLTIAKIPSPSNHEEKRAQFCCNWLKEQGAEGVYIDEALNVVYPAALRDNVDVYMAHTDVVFQMRRNFL